jgi:biopolymer transport protein ExbD
MSVGGAGGEERPMSDINTTPLVDVMLVLLIIFLIAVPVAIQTIEKLKVPVLASEETQDKVENLLLAVVTTDALAAARRTWLPARRATANAASISTT